MEETYLTVTALTKYLKQKFDRDPYLQRVYLTGEISNFRLRPNGHQYFSLKDDGGKISCIMFKGAFQKVTFQPQEGQKVLVVGRIGLYEESGSYQIYIEKMEPDGIGALYQAFKDLQKKLKQEGLFDVPKKALPLFPKRIGVITSPSGAVIRDIITTINRRYPLAEIVLFPTVVQGNQAAKSIAGNIKKADALNFDTLIIGRGGGSIEDLWPFNEEIVAREIFAANTPIISSVGHETDTTIADYVADMRAATPTAAAELAVPDRLKVLEKLKADENYLFQNLKKMLDYKKEQVNKLATAYIFTQPQRLYEGLNLKVDNLTHQLQKIFQQNFQEKNKAYQILLQQLYEQDLRHPVALQTQKVTQLSAELSKNMALLLKEKQINFQEQVEKLAILSPLETLQRGFSYTTVADKIIKDTNQLQVGEEVAVHLAKGSFLATVTKIQSKE